jgi:hypothetical protein
MECRVRAGGGGVNVLHERDHLTARLNKLSNDLGTDQITPTGRAFVDAQGNLWYEYWTVDLDPIGFWATRASKTPGGPRYTIAHNQTEMEQAFSS